MLSDAYSSYSFWRCTVSVGCITDYAWHLVLPITAMALGAFTTMTFLTKNSFLDEIRKQYVVTARAKGLDHNEVLYGHVFRNAMLLIIAGFPGAFIHAFFAGALLISTASDCSASNRSSTVTIPWCLQRSTSSLCSVSS